MQVYKKLMRALGDFSDKYPSTGMDKYFSKGLEVGLKIMPKDKRALQIIDYVLSNDTAPAAVQKFLNLRFIGLPVDIRPIYKADKGRKLVAFWCADGNVMSKVVDLVGLKSQAKGYWCDEAGKKVSLVDISKNGGSQ